MKITAVKTEKIKPSEKSLFEILEKNLKKYESREGIIIAITSKIVAICEGSVIKKDNVDKKKLIEKEADFVLPFKKSKYDIILTLKNNILIPTAGIDESNADGFYVLWPKEPQKTANAIRKYLQKHLLIKNLGVIITDSKTTPLRRGTTGVAITHSGFLALKNYINQPDIFGKKLKVTKSNIMDSLAAAAVLAMGEGNEQTPIAVIEDVSFVKFKKSDPSKSELGELKIGLKDDLYAPLLTGVKWQKGRRG